jgi:hypothetical protein
MAAAVALRVRKEVPAAADHPPPSQAAKPAPTLVINPVETPTRITARALDWAVRLAQMAETARWY